MTPTYGFGFDPGNRLTVGALYTSDKLPPRLLALPSIVSPGNIKRYHALQTAQGKASVNVYDVLKERDFVFQYGAEGPEQFVGELGERQARHSTTGEGDEGRYWSERSRDLLLTVSGALIPDEQYSLVVTTGLPFQTFLKEGVKGKVRRALNGVHSFWLNGRKRTAEIRVGKILMEGAGAVVGMALPKGKSVGIIDIGQFTTDVYAFKDLEVIDYMCGGMEIGISNVGKRLSDSFQAVYGRALTMAERDEVLRAHVAPGGEYPDLSSAHEEVNVVHLVNWCKQAIEETGKEIKTSVSALWRTPGSDRIGSTLNRVQLVGGGGYYLTSFFRRELFPKLVMSNDPENDNARGYAWFAYHLAQRQAGQFDAAEA